MMATTISVIPLSLTSESAEGTANVRVLQVPSPKVPVDVLQEIAPHLQFEDRLNISLLSKTIYAALPPRHIHVVLDTIRQLASFAAFISHDPTRALALRSLHVINYYLPPENQFELQEAQKSVDLILESAINLEELVCQGDAACDLVPQTLTTSRRLTHVALQGRTIMQPKFVLKLAQSLPSLTTLHFERTPLPVSSIEYAVDHLILANIPFQFRYDPVPWKFRRFTCVLRPNHGHSNFTAAHCRVDLSVALSISITAPVISAQIWADLVANAWDVRLLEFATSITSFTELVAPLVRLLKSRPSPHIVSTRKLGVTWDSRGTWEQARNDFLWGASAHFPSLRYIAVATPYRPARIAPPPAYPGDDIPVWTWWRVRRDGAGIPVEIKEIPVWEGQRVRGYLRDADAEAMRDFERTFVALH
uniref:Thiol-transferase Tc52 n=1 Tax=Ganoderma boninense TaxID=34458 RepID=A0A5K1K5P1_9APHY